MHNHIRLSLALVLLILIPLLGSCGSGNKEGQPASVSTATSGSASPDNNVQAEITGVTINSPPLVTFKLFDENGTPLDPTTSGLTVRFYIAQLKADGTYANYEGSVKNADGTTSGDPSYESTTTTNGKGTLASVGNGVYTYTFFRDIKDATKTLKGLAYDATKTHTVAIQVYRDITDTFGRTFQQTKNVYFNFRPDGGTVTQTREIVATSNCNECHGKLAVHGGSRREVALCILCHNPGNVQNGVPFDFRFLVHRIHMGKKLPGNVAAIAAGGNGLAIGGTKLSDVGFPFMSGDGNVTGRPIECTKCHRIGTDINGRSFGRDAERWRYGMDATGNVDTTKSSATKENCTTCHDTTVLDGSATANVADATYNGTTKRYTAQLTAVTASPHTSGPAADGSCGTCHPSEVVGDNAYKASIPGHHAIFEKSSVFTGLNYQILSVTNATPGNKPTVTFKITDDSGNSVSPIASTHIAGTSGSTKNDVSFNLKLGYFKQVDYVNEGMNNYGQPLSQATNGLSATLTPAGTTNVGTGAISVPASANTPTANADGSYTITFFQAIPATATGTGVIGLEGTRYYTIPATQRNAARAVRAGGKAVQYYFDLATGNQVTDPAKQRRKIVDAEAKCDACHGRLALHGGARTNNVQECVICHNPNGSDRSDSSTTAGNRSITKDGSGNITAYNVGADGKFSQPIHFKVLIHRIHTGENLDLTKNNANGTVSFFVNGTSNDFSDVAYPRDRRDCSACHVDDDPIVYGLPLPDGALGTTTLTGATITGTTPTFTTSIQPPITATCLSCHDTQVALDHASGHVSGSGATAQEFCTACHRTGLVQGVDAAHKPVR